MSTITKRQIAGIAAATKRICSADGYGHQVVVWPDGGWSEAVSSNDITGRGNSHGGFEIPLYRFCFPSTPANVQERLKNGVYDDPNEPPEQPQYGDGHEAAGRLTRGRPFPALLQAGETATQAVERVIRANNDRKWHRVTVVEHSTMKPVGEYEAMLTSGKNVAIARVE